MDYFTYTFNEDVWNIFIIDDGDEVLADSNTAAQVMFESKEIYFRKSELTLGTVMHELVHVYFGYCYLSDTQSMTKEDLEEIFASMFEDKAVKIIERSNEVYKKLMEMRKQNEKEPIKST